MIYITRRERFCSAHKLVHPEWDAAKNLEVFGPCSNENWHGHNFVLFVTVKGEVNPDTGFVVNLKDSTEVLAIEIWNQLAAPVKAMGVELHCIKIQETENNFVEYFG